MRGASSGKLQRAWPWKERGSEWKCSHTKTHHHFVWMLKGCLVGMEDEVSFQRIPPIFSSSFRNKGRKEMSRGGRIAHSFLLYINNFFIVFIYLFLFYFSFKYG